MLKYLFDGVNIGALKGHTNSLLYKAGYNSALQEHEIIDAIVEVL